MVVQLPSELEAQIFEHLAAPDLCSVARASRWYLALALPPLYRHVVIHRQRGEVQAPGLKHFRAVAAFLLARTDVACYVRALTLHGPLHTAKNVLWHSRLHGHPTTTTAHRPLEEPFRRAIEAYGLEQADANAWTAEMLLEGNDDAVLGLLLPALTRLRRLDIELPYTPVYFDRALHLSGTSGPERLWEDVVCKSGDAAMRGCRPSMFARFLAVPCMRRIFVHRVGSSFETIDEVLSSVAPRSSGVVHLELKDCLLNAVDLSHLLLAPAALHTFIYEVGNRQLAYCDLNILHIRACLEHQRDSLQDLWLDDYDELGVGLTLKWPITSLSDFAALRRVRISSTFVYHQDGPPVSLASFLPPSLEHLHLTRCEARYDSLRSSLQEFIPCRHRLRSVTLQGTFGSENLCQWLHSALAEVRRLAQRVTPALEIIVICVPDEKYPLRPEWPERKWGMDEDITFAECPFNMLRHVPHETIELA